MPPLYSTMSRVRELGLHSVRVAILVAQLPISILVDMAAKNCPIHIPDAGGPVCIHLSLESVRGTQIAIPHLQIDILPTRAIRLIFAVLDLQLIIPRYRLAAKQQHDQNASQNSFHAKLHSCWLFQDRARSSLKSIIHVGESNLLTKVSA